MSATDYFYQKFKDLIALRGFDNYTPLVIDEVIEEAIEVTAHPIESGSEINDHTIKKPTKIVCNYIFEESVLDFKSLRDIYQEIEDLQKENKLLSVRTGKKTYDNMLITNIKLTNDFNNEYVLNLTLEFTQVNLTYLQDVTVESQSVQGTQNQGAKNGQKVGSKATEQGTKGSAEKNTSSLYELSKMF